MDALALDAEAGRPGLGAGAMRLSRDVSGQWFRG